MKDLFPLEGKRRFDQEEKIDEIGSGTVRYVPALKHPRNSVLPEQMGNPSDTN